MTARPQTGAFVTQGYAMFPPKPWYELGAAGSLLSAEVYRHAKRLLDIAVCLALLPVVLLILAVCCVLICLDSPGRPFFTQARTGKGGARFKMLKMRTMVQNAEALKSQYA